MPQVYVVGGADSLIKGNFGRKLSDSGLEVIGFHTGTKNHFTGLPAATESLIVIKDICSHGLSEQAVAAAKERGIPFAVVQRKWALALPILRVHGLVPPAATGTKKPNPSDVRAIALDHMVEQRRQGRIAKKGEVEAVLQLAYGPGFTLNGTTFKDLHSRACRKVPLKPIHIADNTANLQPRKPIDEDMLAAAHDWAVLVVEEDPERMLDPERVVTLVQDYAEYRPTGKAQSHALAQAIRDTLVEVRNAWGRRKQPQDERERRNLLMSQWLTDWFHRFGQTGEDFPGFKVVMERSKAIFGVFFDWDLVRDVRAKALGEWTRDLIGTNKASEYAGFDVRPYLVDGQIQSIQVNRHKVMTSVVAIDAYRGERPAPVVVPPPPATPEQPAGQDSFEGLMKALLTRLESIDTRLAKLEDRPVSEAREVNPVDLLNRLLQGFASGKIQISFNPTDKSGG